MPGLEQLTADGVLVSAHDRCGVFTFLLGVAQQSLAAAFGKIGQRRSAMFNLLVQSYYIGEVAFLLLEAVKVVQPVPFKREK